MITLLIKDRDNQPIELYKHYIGKLKQYGEVKVLSLPYLYGVKINATCAKYHIEVLIDMIPPECTKLVIADSSYFKFITKTKKVSSTYGTTVQGAFPGYEKYECVYAPNYRSLFKVPENRGIIDLALDAILGINNKLVIQSEEYGIKYGSDRHLLDVLYEHDELAADIETTGLDLDCKLISIAFAWDKSNGVAIHLTNNGIYYLKQFLETYTGTLIWHGALFDVKILVRSLWMDSPTDYRGMLEGLSYFKNIHDTMLLTYLEKNATTEVSLKLKDIALEYSGNYGIDIKNAHKYTKEEILIYNLMDVLSTFYVYEKYHSQLSSQAYKEIFQPSILPIIKMMLVGLPMDPQKVRDANVDLSATALMLEESIQKNPIIQRFNVTLREDACIKKNAILKKEKRTIDDFSHVQFNPGSHTQIIKLLFEVLGLPIVDTTKTGLPKTNSDSLIALKEHATDVDTTCLLNDIVQLTEVNKINNTFIRAFMKEEYSLHGNLRLGGTQSGRLSCLVGETLVTTDRGDVKIADLTMSHKVLVPTDSYKPILHIWDNGIANVYQMTLENGMKVTGTANHRFLTDAGYMSMDSIGNSLRVHTVDGFSKIEDIKLIGNERVYDVEVELEHCYLANGIWSHNSNSPNLTNLPSKGKMGKLIKSCIVAPEGWILCGADFSSLEERVGALLSKDPAREKVYTQGYDSHALRSSVYFIDQMPDIKLALEKAETATKFYVNDNGEYSYE